MPELRHLTVTYLGTNINDPKQVSIPPLAQTRALLPMCPPPNSQALETQS